MSVYEKFWDKNKSKLCESKSKKVSLKKLKRVNESDWKDDLAIRKNIYKIVFPILQKELLNVKFIDKRIDNETFVEHFEEYFDIETMFNSKSYISFIGDDYIIQIIEDTFTDYLGYRYEYSEDADNTYDLNVSGLIQQTVDTIVKAIPKMEDALKAKLGEFNASSVKVKSNLLDDAGGINIEYHFKSNDTISESAKDRFLKKAFSKFKLSESRTLKRTRKVKVPINEAYYAYKPMDTFYKKLKDTSDNIDFCIDTLKTMQNPVTDKDKKEYENLSDEAKKSISKISRNDLEKAYNILMDIMRKLP